MKNFSQMHNDYLDPEAHDGGSSHRRKRRGGPPRQKPDSFTTPKVFGTDPAKKLLAYVVQLCQNEVERCGLDTHAGAKAAIAKALLTADPLPNLFGRPFQAASTQMTSAAAIEQENRKALSRRRPGAQQKPKSPPP